jgi:hypothetical protein
MGDRRQLEYFLLRYVPDHVKEEFVNFGVILRENAGDGGGFADVLFTRDWRRVRCLDPQVDIEMLAALESEIRGQLASEHDRAALFKKLGDTFSNVIQLTPAKGCLAEDPVQEMGVLASVYLESSKAESKRVISGRQKILGRMREAFEQAGIAKFVLPVPAEPYTKTGDPFAFDFGYRVGREIKLFHAVSLKASVHSAVLLAGRYARIAPAMGKLTGAMPALTAVVDDDMDRSRDEVQFALSMMEEEKIRIAVSAEMPKIAEVARQELRA